MLGWLRDKFGGKKPDEDAALSLLAEDFKSLKGLSPRVIDYLKTGQDEEVLGAVRADGASLELVAMPRPFGRNAPGRPGRRQFLSHQLEGCPTEVVGRLARVYEAAARGMGWQASQGWEGQLEWLEPLVLEALCVKPYVFPHQPQGRLRAAVLERLLPDAADLYRLYLQAAPQQLDLLEGFAEGLASHVRPLEEALALPGSGPRRALEVMKQFKVPVEPLLPQLVSLSTCSTKTVRELARVLLWESPQATALVAERLPHLSPGERIEALRLLAGWGQLERVRAWDPQEKVARVRQVLEQLLLAATAQASETPEVREAPTPTLGELHAPLHRAVREALEKVIAESQSGPTHGRIEERNLTRLCDSLETARLDPHFKPLLVGSATAQALLDVNELTLAQAVRLSFHMQRFTPQQLPYSFAAHMTRYRRRHQPRPSLQELAAVCAELGVPRKILADFALHHWWGGEFLSWEPEAVWPFLAANLTALQQALLDRSNGYEAQGRRQRALDLLGRFPVPPAEVQESLWQLALGSARGGQAQALLARVAGFEARVVQSLGDGRQEIRTAAAAWLARLRVSQAEPALRKALQKEKQELARAAMLTALESLGVPLQEFLNRELLGKEARGVRVPDSLQWFPFDQLPRLHWMDTGEPVDPAILTFWVVRAHKLKVPEASPLLRLYCQQLVSADRETLGRYVLGSWLARDAATGSTIADKGLLSLAGACGGGELVRASEHYLKTWYGHRAAQCKALLAMLASTGEPLALQMVLGVASRFRTKGIQQEAERQARLLAERRGWTVAELADRSVPTGGLDSDGCLTLDYGGRVLLARLKPDFSLALFDGDKSLSALPEPRQCDDPDRAAAARKLLAAAKKELKSVQKLQKERLYEAMCTQRGWSYQDWRLFLWEHPLMRFYCQRLVWAVEGGEQSFRPLADGALSDAHDRDLEPGPQARITLAHAALVDAQAWQQHLAEYEVQPLFAQFGRPLYPLAEEGRERTQVSDFRGHMLEAYRLRSRATALGYTRGPSEDGGWFFCYTKRFPELQLEVRLGFSGNRLPEENRAVALEDLSFERVTEQGPAGQLALGEVPPILLSECYQDLAALAAEGPGFDPDWQKKVH